MSNAKRSPQLTNWKQIKKHRGDKPIPADLYPVIDNDLARDNMENDIPAADLQDL